jgi:hypothetical protein
VLYGIGGDLSQKMIIPALPVIGVDRGDLDIVALRKHVHDSVHVPFRHGRSADPHDQVHAAAWKTTFDELLSRASWRGDREAPRR